MELGIFDCDGCTDRRKMINGCPDIGAVPSKKKFPDGISVGDGWLGKPRHLFNKCPGYYLRRGSNGPSIDGVRNAFDMAWQQHFLVSKGNLLEEMPCKMREAVMLIEAELRAREALAVEKTKRDSKRRQGVISK